MRTSLNEIQEAESFLLNNMQPGQSLLFQAKMITNPILMLNVKLQAKVMEAALLFHRRKLKSEIQSIHNKLITDPYSTDFRLRINKIFPL
jgi:hypothetical protein